MTIRKEMNCSDSMEAVELELWHNESHVKCFFIYNPPKNNPSLDWLESLWGDCCIALGDFNAHSTRWGYDRNDPVGNIVEDLIDSNPIVHVENDKMLPTFLSYSGFMSHPDLVLAHPHISQSITHQLENPPGGAGQKLLLVSVSKNSPRLRERRFPRWNLKKADWKKYQELTNESVNESVFQENTDKTYKVIKESLVNAALKCIPRGQVKKYKPFWSPALQKMKKEKDKARMEAERLKTPDALRTLQTKEVQLKEAIRKAKKNCYSAFLEKLDFRRDGVRAHKFLSRINNDAVTTNNPMLIGEKEITKERDIASHFCKHYAGVSNFHPKKANGNPSIKLPATCLKQGEFETFNSPFTLSELNAALHATQAGKSAGPDGILPEFLLNLGPEAKKTILQFFNSVWEGQFPDEWKKAEIIPILKKNQPKNRLASFRPIALTSACSKVMERLALGRLMSFLDNNNLLSANQAGFRRHRSTVDHVTRLSQDIKDGYHRKQSTIAVFVDFSTAFDRVWRKRLIQKSIEWGLHGNLSRFISAFLSQRFIRVRYKHSTSGFRQTRQGLPQGSVLSPTLFNIMINDVVATLENAIPGLNVLLFADDLVLWASSSSIPDLETCINKALADLSIWAEKNEMEVNPLKTEFQLFTLSTKPPPVAIQYKDMQVKRTESALYLGVKFDKRLTWNNHADHAISRGLSRLKLLKRLAGSTWGASQDLLTKAYQSYVRPAMMYGSELLVTSSSGTVKKIERVQSTALRLITGAAKSTPIAAMQSQVGIDPIKTNIEMSAMILNEKLRRLQDPYWHNYKPASGRLVSQVNFTQKVADLTTESELPLEQREPFSAIKQCIPFACDVTLLGNVSKNNANELELKAAALETIHERYPAKDWFHVYTDGSAEGAIKNGGAGVYSAQFRKSAAVGKNASNFDSEMMAILLALEELCQRRDNKTVIFVDSQAAIKMLCGHKHAPSLVVGRCLKILQKIRDKGREVVLQWIPGHCGVKGNEEADRLAREASTNQQPDPLLPFQTAKRMIKAAYKLKVQQEHATAALGKSWEPLTQNNGQIPNDLKRRESVALFRMITGHDYLQKHLCRIGVVNSPECPLCHTGEMDAEHLMSCPSLADVARMANDNSSLPAVIIYWAARRRMATIPEAGVG